MNKEKEHIEESEVLVKVEGLSKKFAKDLKTSLWYGVKDLITGIRGNKKDRELRPKEFWAVKGISFELRRGECLGLIGHNGAGKSTLLKILNGLINPDEGKVTIRGRVGALIELGAGFNPILTGRENIYNNGAVLGFSRAEINEKLQTIIDFADLEEFIDMPVQNYSSGMKVRLGFAVAAQMEPDVLIVDEILAVGDLGFKLKCFKTIDQILPNTAIIFVSHTMPMVSRICNQIILMEHGKSQFQGEDVSKAIDLYYRRFSQNNSNVIFSDGNLELKNIELMETVGLVDNIPQLNWGDNLKLLIELKINDSVKLPEFFITISDKEQRPVALLKPNDETLVLKQKENTIKFLIKHENFQLSKGVYSINFTAITMDTKAPLLRINDALSFQILYDREIWPPFLLGSTFEGL